MKKIPFLKLVMACVCLFGVTAPLLAHPVPVHHDLKVTLHPQDQRLSGVDMLTLQVPSDQVMLTLAEDAGIKDVSIGEKTAEYTFQSGSLRIPVPDNLQESEISVTVSYEAFFRDVAPKDPAYTEDPSYGVTGVVSSEATFLLASAEWYPDLPGSKSTFRLTVKAPAGYEAVTAGKRVSRSTKRGTSTSVWETTQPSRGLALSAGPYVVRETEVQEIPIYTYFFPEDDHLSKEYLEATANYLKMYTDLFGPYPFEKFAVVENFFPTGYGFSSYTLLGRKVIRLPFILETSLGHEVSHAWWGNGVLVEPEQGNWSEGLTSYVADHLYKEKSSAKEGREYRLRVLRSYATLVSPENDFPLQDFTSRTSPSTHAVGYGKTLMIFHMARRLVGEEAFWKGLRWLFRQKLFQQISWDDFALAFERGSKRDLKPFFRQWVTEPGAPRLALEDVKARNEKQPWTITGRLTQQAPFYSLEVPLRVEAEGGEIDTKIFLTGEAAPFTIQSKTAPRRLVVDPEVDLFRRLDPSEIPPIINGIKGAGDSLVALAARGLSKETLEASKILLEAFGQKDTPILPEDKTPPSLLEGCHVLYLGVPEGKGYLPPLPAKLFVSQNSFTMDGVTYDTPGDTLFVVFSGLKETERVMGLFLPLSNKAAASAARKISHYGKYSYLVFKDGVNQIKGTWPVTASPLIHTFRLKKNGP